MFRKIMSKNEEVFLIENSEDLCTCFIMMIKG